MGEVQTFWGQVKTCDQRNMQWRSGYFTFQEEEDAWVARMFLKVNPQRECAKFKIGNKYCSISAKGGRLVVEDKQNRGKGMHIKLEKVDIARGQRLVEKVKRFRPCKRSLAEVRAPGLSPSPVKSPLLSPTVSSYTPTQSPNQSPSPTSSGGWLSKKSENALTYGVRTPRSLTGSLMSCSDGGRNKRKSLQLWLQEETGDRENVFTSLKDEGKCLTPTPKHATPETLKAKNFYNSKKALFMPPMYGSPVRKLSLGRDSSPSSKSKLSLSSKKPRLTGPMDNLDDFDLSVGSSENDSPDDIHTRSSKDSVGFANLGNTCFMNAVLQCLCALEPYTLDVQNIVLQHGSHLKGSSLLRLLHQLMKHSRNFSSEQRIKKTLNSIRETLNQKFAVGLQQDAHELLSELLDMTNDEVQALKLKDDDKAPEKFSVEELISPTESNFRLTFRNHIHFHNCETEVLHKEEPDMTLMLALGSQSDLHLQDCVDEYFRSGEISLKCEKCAVEEKGTITRRIFHRPRYLILNLLRYETSNTESKKKLDKVVIPKYISIADFCDASVKGPVKCDPVFLEPTKSPTPSGSPNTKQSASPPTSSPSVPPSASVSPSVLDGPLSVVTEEVEMVPVPVSPLSCHRSSPVPDLQCHEDDLDVDSETTPPGVEKRKKKSNNDGSDDELMSALETQKQTLLNEMKIEENMDVIENEMLPPVKEDDAMDQSSFQNLNSEPRLDEDQVLSEDYQLLNMVLDRKEDLAKFLNSEDSSTIDRLISMSEKVEKGTHLRWSIFLPSDTSSITKLIDFDKGGNHVKSDQQNDHTTPTPVNAEQRKALLLSLTAQELMERIINRVTRPRVTLKYLNTLGNYRDVCALAMDTCYGHLPEGQRMTKLIADLSMVYVLQTEEAQDDDALEHSKRLSNLQQLIESANSDDASWNGNPNTWVDSMEDDGDCESWKRVPLNGHQNAASESGRDDGDICDVTSTVPDLNCEENIMEATQLWRNSALKGSRLFKTDSQETDLFYFHDKVPEDSGSGKEVRFCNNNEEAMKCDSTSGSVGLADNSKGLDSEDAQDIGSGSYVTGQALAFMTDEQMMDLAREISLREASGNKQCENKIPVLGEKPGMHNRCEDHSTAERACENKPEKNEASPPVTASAASMEARSLSSTCDSEMSSEVDSLPVKGAANENGSSRTSFTFIRAASSARVAGKKMEDNGENRSHSLKGIAGRDQSELESSDVDVEAISSEAESMGQTSGVRTSLTTVDANMNNQLGNDGVKDTSAIQQDIKDKVSAEKSWFPSLFPETDTDDYCSICRSEVIDGFCPICPGLDENGVFLPEYSEVCDESLELFVDKTVPGDENSAPLKDISPHYPSNHQHRGRANESMTENGEKTGSDKVNVNSSNNGSAEKLCSSNSMKMRVLGSKGSPDSSDQLVPGASPSKGAKKMIGASSSSRHVMRTRDFSRLRSPSSSPKKKPQKKAAVKEAVVSKVDVSADAMDVVEHSLDIHSRSDNFKTPLSVVCENETSTFSSASGSRSAISPITPPKSMFENFNQDPFNGLIPLASSVWSKKTEASPAKVFPLGSSKVNKSKDANGDGPEVDVLPSEDPFFASDSGQQGEKENLSEVISSRSPAEAMARVQRLQEIESGKTACSYRLVGLVNHIGVSLTAGHYTSNCYNLKRQKWYLMDDSHTVELRDVEASESNQRNGYVFFYMDKELFDGYVKAVDAKKELKKAEGEDIKATKENNCSNKISDTDRTSSSDGALIESKDKGVLKNNNDSNIINNNNYEAVLQNKDAVMTDDSAPGSKNSSSYLKLSKTAETYEMNKGLLCNKYVAMGRAG